jgi:DNA-binding MarR family transcriptional regulator
VTGPRPRDSVEELLDAWKRERPDVDTGPLAVFSRLSRIAVHLSQARAAAFSSVDLEEWGFDVLAALRRSGPPYRLSPGTLVRQNLVSSATMTHRLDRLESAGLVARSPDPDDGRGVVVTLTAAGRVKVDRALELLTAAEAALLEGLTQRDQAALTATLRRLLADIELRDARSRP